MDGTANDNYSTQNKEEKSVGLIARLRLIARLVKAWRHDPKFTKPVSVPQKFPDVYHAELWDLRKALFGSDPQTQAAEAAKFAPPVIMPTAQLMQFSAARARARASVPALETFTSASSSAFGSTSTPTSTSASAFTPSASAPTSTSAFGHSAPVPAPVFPAPATVPLPAPAAPRTDPFTKCATLTHHPGNAWSGAQQQQQQTPAQTQTQQQYPAFAPQRAQTAFASTSSPAPEHAHASCPTHVYAYLSPKSLAHYTSPANAHLAELVHATGYAVDARVRESVGDTWMGREQGAGNAGA
ncbi:hypothetical protein DFH06DRAFT_1149405 [Mycena polygramma]|nr:hypothetical protein DFH06DRAFT_1149405 [Mycena polygramma]